MNTPIITELNMIIQHNDNYTIMKIYRKKILKLHGVIREHGYKLN